MTVTKERKTQDWEREKRFKERTGKQEDCPIVNEGIKSIVADITPEKAEAWLKKIGRNRRLSEKQVDKLARAMKEGRWSLNGQTIKFNNHGELFDGQHRLHAVLRSGCTIQSVVLFGIHDPNAVETVDVDTRVRGVSQILETWYGVKNASHVGAIARRLLAWESTVYKHSFTLKNELFKYMPQKEIIDYAVENQREINPIFADVKHSLPLRRCKAASATTTALIICNRVDDVATMMFIEGLKTGANLPEKSSVMLLRDRMITPPERGGLGWEQELMALIIKAWNYHAANKTMTNLRWRQEGPSAEKFPVPGDGINGS